MSTDDWLFYKVTVSEVVAQNRVGFVEGLVVMNETAVREGGTIYQASINLTDE
jgi:hypothetical protein